MRRPFLSYLLWVLLPVGIIIPLSRGLSLRAHENRILESGERFGGLAAVFLAFEGMGVIVCSKSLGFMGSPPSRCWAVVAAGPTHRGAGA